MPFFFYLHDSDIPLLFILKRPPGITGRGPTDSSWQPGVALQQLVRGSVRLFARRSDRVMLP
jgi:hypothetical protein